MWMLGAGSLPSSTDSEACPQLALLVATKTSALAHTCIRCACRRYPTPPPLRLLEPNSRVRLLLEESPASALVHHDDDLF